MFLKRKALALFPLLLVAGCSSIDGVENDVGNLFQSNSNNPIRIQSVPTGADVYVMGEKVGTTPLKIEQKDVFPNSYPKEKQDLYGKVTLKKAGCSDYVKTVNTKIIDVGLKARLDCGQNSPAIQQGSAPQYSMPARMSKTVEQRLEEIKDLQNKGLITDDE
ncbi:MAG TPA: PEGA domain-containing protein, partial [Burkholderiales bacterium]|nr:PEGA domain-containing protein [Burkholderiales bacterium]